jgi:hypothetical protein
MVGADIFGLEPIMLDSIELFADSSGMPLPGIPDALEIRAVNLSTFG